MSIDVELEMLRLTAADDTVDEGFVAVVEKVSQQRLPVITKGDELVLEKVDPRTLVALRH